MSESERTAAKLRPLPPAFYARPRISSRRAAGDWWTILHPPYTLWHLSYVVIGACLVGPVDAGRLVATVAAFFLAVGIGVEVERDEWVGLDVCVARCADMRVDEHVGAAPVAHRAAGRGRPGPAPRRARRRRRR